MAQGLEGESEGAKVSPKEAPAPGESPQIVVGSSRAVLPTETTSQGERALETACEILEHIHTIHLQTMHEIGGVRELEQTLVRTLMAEFARLQLILGEDLTKNLTALHSSYLRDLISGYHSGDRHAFLDLKPIPGIISQHYRDSVTTISQGSINRLHIYPQRESRRPLLQPMSHHVHLVTM